MPTASVASIYDNEIVSSFDIVKPEFLPSLFKRRGEQGGEYFQTISTLGWKLPVANETYGHFEDDFIHENFVADGAAAAAGAGDDVDITITTPDVDASDRFYPRVNDVIMTKDRMTGVIVAIDISTPASPVLTVEPNDVTDLISVADQETIIIISGAHGEGSTQPDSAFSGTFKYENDVQIIKETLTATGTEMTDGLWFQQIKKPGEGGGEEILGYQVKGQLDAEYRIQLKMEGALLYQKRTTNPDVIDPDSGKLIKTTEGLVPYIERLGNILNYTSGTLTVAKFDEIDKVLDQEYAPDNTCFFQGLELHQETDNVLANWLKDTNVVFAKEVMGGKEVDINFKYLNKSGRTYALKKLHSLSDPKRYGSDGFSEIGLGIIVPLGYKKDRKTGKSLPTIGYRHKKLGPYDRMMEIWNVSGAGTGFKVLPADLHNLYLRTHIGAHYMAGNQMILLRKS